MDKVIITIRRADRPFARDLELSPAARIDDIVSAVVHALHWDQAAGDMLVGFEVEAPALKRRLDPAETLAQAQLWDGAILIFHPVNKGRKPVIFRPASPERPAPQPTRPQANPPAESPLIGWKKTFT